MWCPKAWLFFSESFSEKFWLFARMPWSTIEFILFRYRGQDVLHLLLFLFLFSLREPPEQCFSEELIKASVTLWLVDTSCHPWWRWMWFFFVVVFWHPSGARWLVVTVAQERQVTILENFFFLTFHRLFFLFVQGKCESIPLCHWTQLFHQRSA